MELLDASDRALGIATAQLAAALPFDWPQAARLVGRLLGTESNAEVRGALIGASVMLGSRSPAALDILRAIERASTVRARRLSGLIVIPPKDSGELEDIPTRAVYSKIRDWTAPARTQTEDTIFLEAAREVISLFPEKVFWNAP